jgi:hypothetical protein
MLAKLLHCFHPETYKKDQVVVAEGSNVRMMYIIKSGEFEVIKTLMKSSDVFGPAKSEVNLQKFMSAKH